MRRLIEPLYAHFGALHHEGKAADSVSTTVLQDSVQELCRQHEQLPDSSCDEQAVAALTGRIAALAEQDTAPADEPVEETVSVEEPAVVAAEDADNVVMLNTESPEQAVAEAEEQQPEAVQDESSEDVVETQHVAVDSVPEQAQANDPYAGLDQELYEIFLEESAEIMDNGETVLRNWSREPENSDFMAEFQRMLHTLKGGARMVDITTIGDLSHGVESLLTLVGEGRIDASQDLFSLLHESFDRLSDMLDKVRSREETAAASDLETRLEAFMKGDSSAATAPVKPVKEATPATAEQPEKGKKTTTAADKIHAEKPAQTTGSRRTKRKSSGPLQPAFSEMVARSVATQPQGAQPGKVTGDRREQVRVQSDVLDNLVNNAGEINIYRARMEQQVSNYRFNLGELDQTISRLREQLRKLEMETEAQILYRFEQESDSVHEDFDPLEMDRYSTLQQLSRSLSESISDLSSLQEIMETSTRDAETLLLQQSRVSTDLQESLIWTRMIPFAGLTPRLQRIVRQGGERC
jgi:chemosensory pili system protein ChpA (sensor histidine kinase/response regulator)